MHETAIFLSIWFETNSDKGTFPKYMSFRRGFFQVRSKAYRFEAEKTCNKENSTLSTTIEPEFIDNIESIWWEGSIWVRSIDWLVHCTNWTLWFQEPIRNLPKTDIHRLNYSFFKIRSPDDPQMHVYFNASNEPKQLNDINFDDDLSFSTCNIPRKLCCYCIPYIAMSSAMMH